MSEYSVDVLADSDELDRQTRKLMAILAAAHRQWVKELTDPSYVTALATHCSFRAMARLLSIEPSCKDLPEFIKLINAFADDIHIRIEPHVLPTKASA